MLELILAVSLSLLISATCSLSEAVLYSVPLSYVETLNQNGSKVGKLLYSLRKNIDQPITAILTLNTIANTAGATIASAMAVNVFGTWIIPWFAAGFTILILIIAEILPKTIGVTFARQLSPVLAYPVSVLIIILKPLIWLIGVLSNLFKPKISGPSATQDDIKAITSLTRQSGLIQPSEEISISNILSLRTKKVQQIMTPRTVVFSLPIDTSLMTAYEHPSSWQFSRIPVYGENNEDILGIVTRRRILREVAEDNINITLADIVQPVGFALETQTLDALLKEFLKSRMHIAVVLDEYGGLAGVVSLEDVLEEILGQEIVDDSDDVVDLRALAKKRRTELINGKHL